MTCLFYCHINYFTFSHHFASDVSFGIIKHLLTRYSGNSKFIKLLTFHLRTPICIKHTPKWQKNINKYKPEALKSLYRSPGYKKNQLVLCKNYVLQWSGSHLGITINIKNTKFVKDLPMIDAQFRFNQCNSFREEYISVFSPYGPVLIL